MLSSRNNVYLSTFIFELYIKCYHSASDQSTLLAVHCIFLTKTSLNCLSLLLSYPTSTELNVYSKLILISCELKNN